MSFCPRCGAASQPAMSFCTACGEMLPTVPVAPAVPAAHAPTTMEGPPRGPVGKRVHPLLVVVLSLVTVGLYVLYFWWRTTREMDAFAGSRAHPPARIGVLLMLAGTIVTILAVAGIIASLDLEAIASGAASAPSAEELQRQMLGEPLFMLGLAFNAGGAAVLYVGLWRMWSALRDEETQRGRPQTFDPRLAVGVLAANMLLSLLGYAVMGAPAVGAGLGALGFVLSVLTYVVYYVTQARLNETWAAATPPPWTPPPMS